MFSFDTRSNEWTLVQPTTRVAPSRRRGHTAVMRVSPATGPELVIFGGVGPNPEETKDIPLNDTWAFRIDENQWVQLETVGEVGAARRRWRGGGYGVLAGCGAHVSKVVTIARLLTHFVPCCCCGARCAGPSGSVQPRGRHVRRLHVGVRRHGCARHPGRPVVPGLLHQPMAARRWPPRLRLWWTHRALRQSDGPKPVVRAPPPPAACLPACEHGSRLVWWLPP